MAEAAASNKVSIAVVQKTVNLKEPHMAITAEEEAFTIADCGEMDVCVQWLWAPIHPSSINILQGKYVFKPNLPYIGGAEGCGIVLEVGSAVSQFSKGDCVIRKYGSDHNIPGCWQSHQICPAKILLKVQKSIDQQQASMGLLNPMTAYGLLDPLWHGKDLQKGDWIIQNAGNSAVGQCIIQIAKVMGLKTVSLVRRQELISELKSLGADEVVIDNDECIALAKLKGKMKIAINAVGGDSAKRLSKCLLPEGVMITYGAMSRQPIVLSNSALIFYLMTYIGFHLNAYKERVISKNGSEALEKISAQLLEMVAQGKLKQRVDSTFELAKCKEAIQRAFQAKRKGKVLLQCSSI